MRRRADPTARSRSASCSRRNRSNRGRRFPAECRRERSAARIWRLGVVLAGLTRCVAATQTTTTTIQYNADGAPTAVTSRWGRSRRLRPISRGGISPKSGGTDHRHRQRRRRQPALYRTDSRRRRQLPVPYDVRDRLIGCSPPGRTTASYSYHPTSLMASSTLASGDALQFYYDDGATPLMVNTRQPSTGLAASFLGPRALRERWHRAGVAAAAQGHRGRLRRGGRSDVRIQLEPYGAPLSASTATSGLSSDGTSYDLAQNPFQYAGEYQDRRAARTTFGALVSAGAADVSLRAIPAIRCIATVIRRAIRSAAPTRAACGPPPATSAATSTRRSASAPGIWAYIEPGVSGLGQVLGGIELVGVLSVVLASPDRRRASSTSASSPPRSSPKFGERRTRSTACSHREHLPPGSASI